MALAHDIDIQSAGDSLRRHLERFNWLTAVGIGADQERECLFVYARQLNPTIRSLIPNEWKGFRVIPRRMTLLRPI